MSSVRRVHINGEAWVWSARSMRKWPGYINIYSPSKRLYRVPLKEFVLTPERCGVTQAQCDSCCYCMEYGTVPVTPGNVKKYIEEKILA